tara:strand:- start:56 stop:610 length:555 start_codon:yes stop_codon:yes gene_type:complete
MPDPVKKTVVKRKNRTTSVKNADGTTTKTRVRRDGSTKKVKTYKGNKTVASKVVKFRKDGTKKKEVTRPGDKTGTVVKTFNKQGKKTTSYNKKKRLKEMAVGGAKFGLAAAGAISSGAIVPIATAAGYSALAAGGLVTAKGINNKLQKLRKAKPGKAIRKAGNWAMKGVRNKIQTGNRKGRSKR